MKNIDFFGQTLILEFWSKKIGEKKHQKNTENRKIFNAKINENPNFQDFRFFDFSIFIDLCIEISPDFR